MSSSCGKQFRWRRKLVTERVYLQRLAQSRKKNRAVVNECENDNDPRTKVNSSSQEHENSQDSPQDHPDDTTVIVNKSCPVEGRRIVDLQLLARLLKCTICKEVLSLEYIEASFSYHNHFFPCQLI